MWHVLADTYASIETFFNLYGEVLLAALTTLLSCLFIYWDLGHIPFYLRRLIIKRTSPSKCFDPHVHFDLVAGDLRHTISQKFPISNSVISVTPIQNDHLRHTFNCKWSELPHLKPLMAFHGTSVSNIASITRRGLLVPGIATGIRVVNGSANGVGIYLGAQPNISMSYVRGGNKMLVCAVLKSPAVKDYGTYYVSTDSACVLPCFVIEFRNGYCGPNTPLTNFLWWFASFVGFLCQAVIMLHAALSFGLLHFFSVGAKWKFAEELHSFLSCGLTWVILAPFKIIIFVLSLLRYPWWLLVKLLVNLPPLLVQAYEIVKNWMITTVEFAAASSSELKFVLAILAYVAVIVYCKRHLRIRKRTISVHKKRKVRV
eukprot:TRINITY_DN3982_c0_g1_i1.p1 TRINITY_DN3982_c0_g1~~TRINITY_DN3982_c0_g1_i1.p1  ORF type:complete len:372 (+),score=28.92 TRINITY_DN3982_c0_g1_i1:85-1200(+)